jgi:hypothetical protein
MPRAEESFPVSCSQCGVRIVPSITGLVPLHWVGEKPWQMERCSGSGKEPADSAPGSKQSISRKVGR